MPPTPESHSTAQAEQLDELCDRIHQRLKLVCEPQTLVQISDALGCFATDAQAACNRLYQAGLAGRGTVPTKVGNEPTFSALVYWHPDVGTPVPCLDPAAAAHQPARTTPKYSPGLRADISEAAAMALCLRRDLELAGEADEVLSDLQRAATGLSRLLLADIRRRGVLA